MLRFLLTRTRTARLEYPLNGPFHLFSIGLHPLARIDIYFTAVEPNTPQLFSHPHPSHTHPTPTPPITSDTKEQILSIGS